MDDVSPDGSVSNSVGVNVLGGVVDDWSDNNDWLWLGNNDWLWLGNNDWLWFLEFSLELLEALSGEDSKDVVVVSQLNQMHSIDLSNGLSVGKLLVLILKGNLVSSVPVSFVVNVMEIVVSVVRISHQLVVVSETSESSDEFVSLPDLGSVVSLVKHDLVLVPNLSESLVLVVSVVVEVSVGLEVSVMDDLLLRSVDSPSRVSDVDWGDNGDVSMDVDLLSLEPSNSGVVIDLVISLNVVDVSVVGLDGPNLSHEVSLVSSHSGLGLGDSSVDVVLLVSPTSSMPVQNSHEPNLVVSDSPLLKGHTVATSVEPSNSECSLNSVVLDEEDSVITIVLLVPGHIGSDGCLDISDVLEANSLLGQEDLVVSEVLEVDLGSLDHNGDDILLVLGDHIFLTLIPSIEGNHLSRNNSEFSSASSSDRSDSEWSSQGSLVGELESSDSSGSDSEGSALVASQLKASVLSEFVSLVSSASLRALSSLSGSSELE